MGSNPAAPTMSSPSSKPGRTARRSWRINALCSSFRCPWEATSHPPMPAGLDPALLCNPSKCVAPSPVFRFDGRRAFQVRRLYQVQMRVEVGGALAALAKQRTAARVESYGAALPVPFAQVSVRQAPAREQNVAMVTVVAVPVAPALRWTSAEIPVQVRRAQRS